MSKRIKEIAKSIVPYKFLADIGCDHGYLINLAFDKGILFAQAVDNKEGPLNIARKNLFKYNDKVHFSLSDGIEDLDPKIDVVVIAGMGGTLITKILLDNIDKLKNVSRLILQPNRNIDKIRLFALNYGFKITQEKIIYEESIYYEIIVLEKGLASYTNSEIMFGPILLKENSQLFKDKWKKIFNHYNEINRPENQDLISLIKNNINL